MAVSLMHPSNWHCGALRRELVVCFLFPEKADDEPRAKCTVFLSLERPLSHPLSQRGLTGSMTCACVSGPERLHRNPVKGSARSLSLRPTHDSSPVLHSRFPSRCRPHSRSFRPFRSANLKGRPSASCSANTSSKVLPSEATSLRNLRVRARKTR